MRLRVITFASGIVALVAACATGSSFQGGEGGSGSGSGASGAGSSTSDAQSSTSEAASTAESASSGAGASSSSSATSGTGGAPPCQESPCKLVSPQCGCAANQQCSVDNMGMRACIGAGNVAPGGSCDVGKCAPGGLCLQTSPTVATCGEFCDTDAQCDGQGGFCLITLNDGNGGSIPGVTLCSNKCDPITSSGCPVAKTSCQGAFDTTSNRAFTICSGAGAGTQGAVCTDSNQCAPGYGCFNANPIQCLKWCNVALQNCSGAQTCVSLSNPIVIGATEYGACL